MPEYWLDSNIFIEGKKGPYGFDIAPRFWVLIDELVAEGRISCPMRVYDELLDGQDDLAAWAQDRRESGLFLEPEAAVQKSFAQIAGYVEASYPKTNATQRFLDRADPWVIAHAIVEGSKVVTMEIAVPPDVQKVKIPNVCSHLNFNVPCVNTYQMLRELGVRWNN